MDVQEKGNVTVETHYTIDFYERFGGYSLKTGKYLLASDETYWVATFWNVRSFVKSEVLNVRLCLTNLLPKRTWYTDPGRQATSRQNCTLRWPAVKILLRTENGVSSTGELSGLLMWLQKYAADLFSPFEISIPFNKMQIEAIHLLRRPNHFCMVKWTFYVRERCCFF